MGLENDHVVVVPVVEQPERRVFRVPKDDEGVGWEWMPVDYSVGHLSQFSSDASAKRRRSTDKAKRFLNHKAEQAVVREAEEVRQHELMSGADWDRWCGVGGAKARQAVERYDFDLVHDRWKASSTYGT